MATKCALVVIDVQNDFYRAINQELIIKINNLTSIARNLDYQVYFVYSNYGSTKVFNDNDQIYDKTHVNDITESYCVPDSYGAQFHSDLIIKPCDIILKKTWYSIFKEHSFPHKKIFLCGVTTNYCVKASALHGKILSYDIVVVSDCISAYTENKHIDHLNIIKSNGIVLTDLKSFSVNYFGEGDSCIIYPVNNNYNNTYNDLFIYDHIENIHEEIHVINLDKNQIPYYRFPKSDKITTYEMSGLILEIRNDLMKRLNLQDNIPFNHCVLKYYANSNNKVSKHSDKYIDMVEGSFICNYSLGCNRKIIFTHKTTGMIKSFILVNDSILIIGYKTNQNWWHEIPNEHEHEIPNEHEHEHENEKRISLTFRSVKTSKNIISGECTYPLNDEQLQSIFKIQNS